MQFSAADQAAMLAAVGETITVGGSSITADYRTNSKPVQLFDGSVLSSAPLARISAADYAATAADIGTAVVARGITYTVAEPPREEESGLWLLILTRGQ